MNRNAVYLVFAVAVAAYAVTIGNEFVWDDSYNVVENAAIRDLTNVPGFFVETWAASAADELPRAMSTHYYRPVAVTSYALDYAFFGLEPAGFHAVNVLIHAICSVLVLLLGWRIFGEQSRGRVGALVGACLFAVHPVHTEAVDVITYRTDLLASLFYVWALVLWLGPESRSPAADRRARFLWVPLLYALGVGSKEMAVTLPLALLLLERVRPESCPAWKQRALRLVPVGLVAIAYLLVRSALLEPSEITYFAGAPAHHVGLTMAGVFGLYVRLLVAPWPLNPFYDWSVLPIRDSLDGVVLLGLVLLVAWGVALWWSWRRDRGLAFCLGLFLIMLLPVSQVVPLIVAAAERFLYLASAGPLLALSVVAARKLRPRLVVTLAVAIGLTLSALTTARNIDWQDDRSVLEANVRDWPRSYNGWLGLARLNEREGLREEARDIYLRLGRKADAARMGSPREMPEPPKP